MTIDFDEWTEAGPRSEVRSLRGSWYITDAGQIRTIRRLIVEIVTSHTRDHDVSLASVSQRLSTVFAELAANALRHAGGPVTASLHLGQGSWLLSVVDQVPERGPGTRISEHRIGGLGLVMVKLLSASVGWDTSGSTKRVWALVGDAAPPDVMSRLQGASSRAR